MIERNHVHQIIRSTLDLPADYEIPEDVPPADVPGWDSFGWMKLIVRMEAELALEIPLDLFDDTESVRDFCDIILRFHDAQAGRT